MNRRKFIKNGTLASFGLPAIISTSHQGKTAHEKKENPFFKDENLLETTIPALQEKMKS